ALNNSLPRDIVALEAEEAKADFHARFSARSKGYSYWIWNEKIMDPFKRLYFLHLPQQLDYQEISKAVSCLKGTQDFSSFRAAGSAVKTSVRTIYQAEFQVQGPMLKFYF